MAIPLRRPVPSAVMTVTELTERLRGVVGREFGEVWVRGQVSQPKQHASGHVYFTMKDDGSVLSCAIWRSNVRMLRFRLEEGQEVVACGRLDVYAPRGNYSLIVEQIEPLGLGALQLAFEQLRKRLAAEGLFEAARKRPLPRMPRRIALVTSRHGAAVRDLVTVITRRFPRIELALVDVRVQGAAAAPDIARGIAFADRHAGADLLIVGRGGGPIEDLWGFNEEVVARAIAACGVPVISAVGHETDFTIADMVADVRAATPSQAGELAVPNRAELCERLEQEVRRLRHRMRVRLDRAWQRLEALGERPVVREGRTLVAPRRRHLDHLAARLAARSPVALLRRRAESLAALEGRLRPPVERRVRLARERAGDLGRRALLAATRRTVEARHRLDAIEGRLRALSPLAVLSRGYSLTTKEDGKVVRTASDASPGDRVQTRLSDGSRLVSRVETSSRPGKDAPEGTA